MWLWQPQLPVARTDRGGSATAPLWSLHSQTPSLPHSAFLPSCPANRIIHRTAVYGPVRTVVWEGRRREAPPYPDFEFGGASWRRNPLGLHPIAKPKPNKPAGGPMAHAAVVARFFLQIACRGRWPFLVRGLGVIAAPASAPAF